MRKDKASELAEAIDLLVALQLPRAQCNARSAICLRALLGLPPGKRWSQSTRPLLGIRDMLDFAREKYLKPYAENTRETFRRQTMHQFVQAQLAQYNPDQPSRAVNSPHAVYQATEELIALVKQYGSKSWPALLAAFLASHPPLLDKYGRARAMKQVPVRLRKGLKLSLSPGVHSVLIKAVIEQFAPRYVPGGNLLYVGDTGKKWAYFDERSMRRLGVSVDAHGKMPDVVFHYPKKNWLLLVEVVTSHGPVDAKRHAELQALFGKSSAGLVFVTALPNRSTMKRYLADIAWETEVWVAEAPTHLIHFNGERFLGPY